MIQHVYENVSKSSMLDEVIVATDHKEIYDHVVDFNGHAEMTSENCKNGTERVYEIAQKYTDYDLFVNVLVAMVFC